MFKKLGKGLATLGAMAAAAYVLFIRPRHLRWGATDEEVQRRMPGDDQVPHPFVTGTRAVTIDAPPEQVWSWLVQMGYRRAGWYAFDRFDNDNIPSAEEIIPALQHLDIGQVIGEEGFAVQAIEPPRLLLLAYHYPKTEWVFKQGLWPRFGDCSWSILLDPIDGGQRTRLVLRMRYGCRLGLHVLYWPLFELADGLSERKMLLGIKRRAERSRRQTNAPARAVTPHQVRKGGHRMNASIIENEIDIRRSPEEVFDYCSDHTREPEWNPKMRYVKKLSAGPMGVGTRYEMEFVPGRPLIVECVRFERPTAWTMEGKTLGMQVSLGGRVTPTSDGTHLVLQTKFVAHGLLGLALPRLRRRMWPEFERDIHTIKAILEGG